MEGSLCEEHGAFSNRPPAVKKQIDKRDGQTSESAVPLECSARGHVNVAPSPSLPGCPHAAQQCGVPGPSVVIYQKSSGLVFRHLYVLE